MRSIKILNNYKKNKFIRNVITLASGTAAAQGINMLFSPIITRIYGPEAFGILGVFVSIISIVTPIVALTYPVAIVLPKSDSEAKRLIRLSLYISLAMSVIVYLILSLFEVTIIKMLQIDSITPFLLFIPIVMLCLASQQVATQWLLRKKQFGLTAKIVVAQSLIVNSSKLSLGLLYPISATLILVTSIGMGIHAVMLSIGARITKTNQEQEIDTSLNKNQKPPLLMLAKKYCDFPLYRGPQEFLAALSQSMPILLLTYLFGPAVAGFYTLGKSILGLPSQLIGKAVGDVFYPRIAEASHSNEKITKLLRKATTTLAAVGLFPFGVIIMFGPVLFSFVFGSEWEIAGEYARWIALWSYALFVSKPCINTIPIISAQKFHLYYTFVNIIFRAIALILGGFVFNNDIIAVALFGLTGAFFSVLLIIFTLNKSEKFDRGSFVI
ncbi:oligosaccharide flippase family protein [Sutcliffiella horikoshii]|uniref:Oligosaccharide flippase family protein n=1 Tax=Sutcliffiella horikoshii TaxID=79883 RepID=A0AA95B7E5_9BACI|nr:oligosaccharide flippase family protein [Sutcliffiella horikoshii]TYS59869.1 oligosaccharide flippase family protein [Sutcliffiella horikoshii]